MNDTPHLTPVQRQAAVERLRENIALCSGAGCGKTLVLARRFAELLLARPEVEDPLPNFVALTFTDKAALEMSQRVRRTLGEFAERSEGPERRRILQWLESMPEARISTIHGFCASLLRSGAVEAGLDPAFTVCGEDDLLMGKLFADAAEQAVLDAVESADAGAADLIERGSFDSVVEQAKTLAAMRTECDLDDYLSSTATLRAWGEELPQAQQMLWRLSGPGEELAPRLEELAAAACSDPGDRLAVAREQILAAWQGSGDAGDGAACSTCPAPGPAPLPSADAFAAIAAADLRVGSAKAWGGKEAIQRVKYLIGFVRERLKGLEICAGSLNSADEQAAKDLAVLARLAGETRIRYQRAKRERGLLDFTDLLVHTRELLRDPALASALRGQIHQLLLDEAQDTDAFQIQMIERLLFGEAAGAPPRGTRPQGRGANGALPPGRLFLVGDPKQSIYRFRGARVEVFRDLCERLGEGNLLYLDLSFRANRQTVGFINHLFGRLMGSDYARIEAHRAAVPPKESVEILLAEGAADAPIGGAAAASRAEAAVTAQRVADMVAGGERLVWDEPAKEWRSVRYGDIAILFSRMTGSLQYERELSARDVPYYVVAGSGFFQQQEVLDLLNALSAIDNPFDDVAFMGTLRSSLFGLDDDALMHIAQACGGWPYFDKLAGLDLSARLGEARQGRLAFACRLIGELHRRKDAVSIDRLLEQLLEETGYEAVLLSQFQGRRLAGNVRRLLELARPGAGGAISLADFLAQMGEHVLDESRYEQAAVVAEAENVVRLMTIHKAKGLEFPVVVLPDLSAGRRGIRDAILHRVDLGLTYRPADGLNAEPDEDGDEHGRENGREPEPGRGAISFLLAKGLENEELRKEDIRRLYVGATRAQDHLIFVGADWRDKEGVLRQKDSPLRTMADALDLAACADGAGRLPYEDGGQSYSAIVRKVAPQPPPRSSRPLPRGRQWLAEARSPDELAQPILAPPPQGPRPELLGPLPAGRAVLDVAVTALADFEHCPMLYRWRYELGVPSRFGPPAGPAQAPGRRPPRPGSEQTDSPPSPQRPDHISGAGSASLAGIGPAEMGTLLHRCMEILDFANPQPAESLVRIAAEELETPSDIRRDAIAQEFAPMLEKFLRHPLGRQVASAAERLPELEFLLQVGPVRLAGQIDLLWRDAAGAWHITDYKSDRVAGQDLAEYARRYELQMLAYAMAASKHLAQRGAGRDVPVPNCDGHAHAPEDGGTAPAAPGRPGPSPVADASLYFLRLGEVQVLPIESEGLQTAQDRLAEIATRLIAARRTGVFPRCRAASCRACLYGRYCQAVEEAPGHAKE
jgi:ATP-dependent helicase/nuclease subunit A